MVFLIIAPAVVVGVQGELGMRILPPTDPSNKAARDAWQSGIEVFDLVHTLVLNAEFLAKLWLVSYKFWHRKSKARPQTALSAFAERLGKLGLLDLFVLVCSDLCTVLHYSGANVVKFYDLEYYPVTWAIYSLRIKILRLLALPRSQT
jgi:hypothetical protein